MDAVLQRLRETVKGLGSCLLAYSGGVDSSLVLRVAIEELGDRFMAVTGSSTSMPAGETAAAAELAARLGARHITINTDEMSSASFRANSPDRCYHCKSHLYRELASLARAEGLACLCDGNNADDFGDYRPGLRAAREWGVRSPLAEAGLTKQEVRRLAQLLGLPNWNKPAQPCLSSRIPYGSAISEGKLRQVEAAESFLHGIGFPAVRVRHHGEIARIELPAEALPSVAEASCRKLVVSRLKEIGFAYISLDLEGLRSGSLNETLPRDLEGAHPTGPDHAGRAGVVTVG